MNDWAILLNEGLWRASAGTVVAGGAALLLVGRLRQSSPGWQQAICLLVLAQGWLLAPVVCEIPWYEARPLVMSQSAETPPAAMSNEQPPLNMAVSAEIAAEPIGSITAPAPPAIAWPLVLVAGWLAGMAGLIGLAAFRYVYFLGLARVTQPVDRDAQDVWRELCADRRRVPQLRFTEALGPLLCRVPGGYRVLIPGDLWRSLNGTQRRAILQHELMHWRRGDVWRNLAAWLLALPQWFNPLAWWAQRRFAELGEWACDDAVTGSDPACVPEYSRAILQTRSRRAPLLAAGAAVQSESRLMVRLKRILSGSRREIPMTWKIACLGGFLALLCAAAVRVDLVAQESPPVAQNEAPDVPTSPARAADPATRAAVQKGLEYLFRRQQEAGNWKQDDTGSPLVNDGLTSLCTYALLQSGVSPDEAALKRALARIRSHKDEYTYTVSLDVLALCAANRLSDLELIRRKVAWLEAAQVKAGESRGSWSYTNAEAGRGDGSNARFAVLALEAADKVGVKATAETWKRVAEYWAAGQNSEGGWGYIPKTNATRNMTCAGLASLAIAEAITRDVDENHTQAVERGLAWLVKHGVAGDDAFKQNFGGYYLHALEQAVRATRTKKLGEQDWRADLQRALLKAQNSETGAWKGGAEDALISTCFALLFLAHDD